MVTKITTHLTQKLLEKQWYYRINNADSALKKVV